MHESQPVMYGTAHIVGLICVSLVMYTMCTKIMYTKIMYTKIMYTKIMYKKIIIELTCKCVSAGARTPGIRA